MGATQIKEEIKVNISKNWFHTDSLTTYYRLQSKDKKQPVFVSNRVNKILLSTKAQEWQWVPTDLNPADVVSRGARPEEEEKWTLFYGGPAYIREDEDCWVEICGHPSPFLSTKAQEWRWVPTDLNPADVVSRGARPEEEEKWELFYGGPAYIREDEDCWPEIPPKEAH